MTKRSKADKRELLFMEELTSLINRHAKENGCDTPDWILAEYLKDCLAAFDRAVVSRETWYGRPAGDGQAIFWKNEEEKARIEKYESVIESVVEEEKTEPGKVEPAVEGEEKKEGTP